MSYTTNTTPTEEATLDIKALIGKLLRNWIYYVVFGLAIAAVAFAYLKLTPSTYLVSTTLLIHNANNTPSEAELLFQNLDLSTTASSLENEIGLIKSFSILQETINSLDFRVSYYEKDLLGTVEKYHNSPYLVRLDTNVYQLDNIPIFIQPQSEEKFSVNIESHNHVQICQFGEPCASDYYSFTVFKGFDQLPPTTIEYFIKINSINGIAEKYRNKLNVNQVGSGSSLLELSITGTLPKKEANFLDKLTEVYTDQNLEEKNQVSQRTINFINSQLIEVSDSLRGAENQLEAFRSQENVMDLSFAATSASEKLSNLESEQADIEVKLRYYEYLLNYIRNDTDINTVVAPSSIGIADPLLNELIIELKRLYSEKVALDYTRSDKSYELNILNLQIENARNSLIENVNNIIQSTQIALQDIDSRIAEVTRVVNKLPENERDLVRIQRKFNLSDNLYNFLLQKRAEAGISKASNRPDHRVIDRARIVGGRPIAPQRDMIYLLSAVLAFIIPTIIVLIKEYLSDKVKSVDQLEKLSDISISGKISQLKGKSISVIENPQTRLAEDFRSLRFNLQYLAPNQKQKVIGITSTVSGEGKTFCAYNLASIATLSSKKVLLIEADLRKPNLKSLNKKLSYKDGLSTYLIGHILLQRVIQTTDINGLDVITSGPIPPNPAELFDSARLQEMMDELKDHYDYIIVDSAPTGLVNDYHSLLPVIDATLYVVRLNYSKLSFINDLQKNYQQEKYKNLSIVVNGVKRSAKEGYGSGYYYYHRNGKGKHPLKMEKIPQ
ncbi:MAG: polysaccharide biosynthesis tyrosine autokinase [Bacteroidota bacterium]